MLKSLLFLMLNQIIIANSNKDATQLAAEHFARILKDAKCETPVTRMVYMSDLFPQYNKKYLPIGTLLHFCGPQSGCCHHESQKCVAKSVEQIVLNFWVIELTPNGNKKSVEKFHFNNHTQCECKHINSNESQEIKDDMLETYSTSIHIPFTSSTNEITAEEGELLSSLSTSAANSHLIITLFSRAYVILFIIITKFCKSK